MIDYNKYIYSKAEYLKYGALGFFAAGLILMLFYQSVLLSLLLSIPAVIGFLKYYRNVLMEHRRQKLMLSFKDLMESLVSALSAGYSMENAIPAAKKDLSLMYPEDSLIICELDYICKRMELGYAISQLLTEWGERSGLEDINDFSRVYATAKKTGGNLVIVMQQTAKNISEKIEVKREMETQISGKKLESKCMSIIPLGIIFYLQVCSPGFLNPLYNGLFGRVVMTGALLLYGVSFLWIRRIMNIKF